MQTFTTPTPIHTILTIPAGRVRLTATPRTDTTVEVLPADPTKNRDVKAAAHTTTAYDNGILRIEAPAKNQYLGPSGAIEVTVHLPTGSHLEAHTAAAELHTTGDLGEVTFHGAHRTATLEHATTLRLHAHAADVDIARLHGPAEISTQKGDIHVGQAHHGTVALRTQAGSIRIGATTGVSATLDAGTAHGRIDNTLTNHGTPELTIHATTSYGDITAHSL